MSELSEEELLDLLKTKITIDEYGTIQYSLDDKRHRVDGSAVIYRDGSTEWWLNGKRHRVNGPAGERADSCNMLGRTMWCLNGKLHRVDGPAFEWTNGVKQWYLHGIEYTKEEFIQKVLTLSKIAV